MGLLLLLLLLRRLRCGARRWELLPKTGQVVAAENWAGGVSRKLGWGCGDPSQWYCEQSNEGPCKPSEENKKCKHRQRGHKVIANIAPSLGQAAELNKQKVCKAQAVNQSQSADRLEATSPVIGRGPAVHPDVRTSLCRRVLQQSPSARDSTMA